MKFKLHNKKDTGYLANILFVDFIELIINKILCHHLPSPNFFNLALTITLIILFLEDSKIGYMDHIFLLHFLAKVHYYQSSYINN